MAKKAERAALQVKVGHHSMVKRSPYSHHNFMAVNESFAHATS